jgi:hypothetical protein
MSPQDHQDWERRLQELEIEVEANPSPSPDTPTPVSQTLENTLRQLGEWFKGLPAVGRVAVAVVGAIALFSLLNSVLRLVASVLSIAILGVILYLLYKFVMTPRSSE